MNCNPPNLQLEDPEDEQPALVIPDEVKSMLGDPSLDPEKRAFLEMGAKVAGAYFAQSLGGVYNRNLHGIPSYNRPRETSAETALYNQLRLKDPKVFRNVINVSSRMVSQG